MKNYNGKAIYQPAGRAAEYAKWACNFYVGCSNGCTYCYLKKGRGAKILGGDKPTLKKCFKDETHALEVFEKELKANLPELQEKGLFFSFSTDPMLPETIGLTEYAIDMATDFRVPVKILTKRADWIDYLLPRLPINMHNMYAFGFTLTGHDEIEPGANTNQERIEAMWKLHKAGFKTFASIEPIIDLGSSYKMIQQTIEFCDLYKVGIESGKKYCQLDLDEFISNTFLVGAYESDSKFYFKDSLLKAANIERSELPANCVTRDYNIFKQQ
ncbi:MAG: hypothetical protein BGO30_08550 [Bacteroidetes bacterium 41-46]|nr:MAG: hypothetical protein BGO30_08550 [Bacteroidetes bacterium 41-46]